MTREGLAATLALGVVDELFYQTIGKGPRALHPSARDQIAQMVAQVVQTHVPPQEPVASGRVYQAVSELSVSGLANLGPLMSPEQVADIRRYLEPHPVYAHLIANESDGVTRTVETATTHSPFGSYHASTILDAPHLLELALDPAVQTIVERYLGCPPTLTSLNVWWSFAGYTVSRVGNSQDFHRDTDTYRSCVMFLYLTDVTPQSGPQCYIKRSHTMEAVSALFAERDIRISRSEVGQKSVYAIDLPTAFRPDARPRDADSLLEPADLFLLAFEGYGATELYKSIFGDLFTVVMGPAGTVFVTDAYGLHAGLPPMTEHRLCVWIRFAVDASYPASPDPALAERIFGHRVADTPRNRFVLRQVLPS
jgi:hypothetical protein